MSGQNEPPGSKVDETQVWSHGDGDRDLTGMTLGDFEVERLLGRGGMGEVYLARQISLNRPVALKVLRPDLLTKPNYIGRFEAEAAAVAKLNHPNIVHVYTQGTVNGIRFIAMEYVQGKNLKEYLAKKTHLDVPQALSVMRQAAMAVGAAGEIGLIHRDIKPENLLLTKKGLVKITDFGLCRDLDGTGRMDLTQPGITMGTPLYMSPEQAQGHELDHRSDLYSLGVTFYQMLTGVAPFKGETPLALALKHVKETPVSMRVHRPDVPPELDKLVLKLMAKSANDRYQSAAELLRDLARLRETIQTAPLPAIAGEVTGGLGVSGMASSLGSGAAPLPVVPPVPERAPTPSVPVPPTEAADAPARAPWLGPRARFALVTAGLLAGGLVGWLARPADLLGESASQPTAMPGLWLAPEWAEVAKRSSAEEQYRDALIRAGADTAEAAWLAVPGYFPASREWASRAYTQLARRLLRSQDARRLNALAADLDRWDAGQTHARKLSALSKAGAAALEGDPDRVLIELKSVEPKNLTDPALLELCLEVISLTDRAASLPGKTSSPALVRVDLQNLQRELVRRLLTNEFREPPANRTRPG